jgi:shikimate dehydrogenase
MRGFGLIGYPLTHSFSKRYFTEKFIKERITDCWYENFPLTGIEGIRELVRSRKEVAGLNVPIPHKERVMHYMDKVNEEAASIGAVNTIKIVREADSFYMEGYNTDIYGFYMSLKPYLKDYHRKALILGTGGASKAVAWVLKKCSISYLHVSGNQTCIIIFPTMTLRKDLSAITWL